MLNSAASILEAAQTKIDQQQNYEALLNKREALVGNIDDAFEAVPYRKSVIFEGYNQDGIDTVDLVVTHEIHARSNHANIDYLDIAGRLRREGVNQPVNFPMYRVGMTAPNTDGGTL